MHGFSASEVKAAVEELARIKQEARELDAQTAALLEEVILKGISDMSTEKPPRRKGDGI